MATNVDRLASIIQCELGVDPRELTPDSPLADLADSLDWINLLTALEESFDLRIDSGQALRLHTLADLMHLVAEHRLVGA